jgi:hypothetical protein
MKNEKWKMENLSSCAEQATALVDSGSYLIYLFNSEHCGNEGYESFRLHP